MIPSKTRTFAVRRVLTLGLLLAALVAAGLSTEKSAQALPILFVVNSSADPGNGLCTAGECTLREAINEANDTPAKDAIHFNIPGGGIKTIKPDSALPEIEEPVTLDGYTQPEAESNTLATGSNAKLRIQLNGANAGIHADGLSISANNSVVRGLVINRFDEGIKVGGSSGDPDAPPQRTRVEGNFVGTNPSGTVDRGNSGSGVFVFGGDGDENTIGGTTPEARNLISGNAGRGVYIYNTNLNEIKGNLIGTEKDATSALGNSGGGVRIYGSGFQNVVGGETTGAVNTIAFNSGDGVTVCCETFTTHNRILRNSIFGNIDLFPDGLGIDLAEDGPTPNDSDDADTGPNTLQNFPILNSAENSGGETTIKGSLNSKPGKKFVLRFFSNPPGSSEGKKYVGKRTVTTNQYGNVSFTFKPDDRVAPGRNVTATATRNSTGDTSEYSAPEEVE